MESWQSSCLVKRFKLEGIEVPSVCLGTSPFIGAGQFGVRAREYYNTFYLNPKNMEKIIKKSIEIGIPAVQVIAYERIIRAVKTVEDSMQIKPFCSVTIGLDNWQEEIKASKLIDPQIAFIFPSITDLKDKEELRAVTEKIRENNMIPGCATHNPVNTIPFLEDSNLDIQVYMAPINPVGKYLGTSPDEMVNILEKVTKPIVGKKVLAAGSIGPDEAFSFVANVKNVKGIALGIASIEEAEETLGKAIHYWPLKKNTDYTNG